MMARTDRRVGSICVLGGSLSLQVRGISLWYRERDDSLDKSRLGLSVPFLRLGIGRHALRGRRAFELFVLARHVGMVSEIVAECQRSPFLASTSFDDVHVMTVRPLAGPMEERTERVVRMRHVSVSKGFECCTVRRKGLKCRHRHLDVDDWFGAQPRNRCRAVMVDSQGQSIQRGTKAGCLGFERAWPSWIVRDDRNLVGSLKVMQSSSPFAT